MRKGLSKILITGGAGFMGSAFVRLLSKQGLSPQEDIERYAKGAAPDLIVIDKLTYAADLARLNESSARFKFYKADICDKANIEKIFKQEKPQVVVNFAASTHVDRSIKDASEFIENNIKGVHILLEAARKHKIKKFIQISSDEVYGEIKKGKFSEDSPLKPNSPYAASKAGADLLIQSYIRTYDFPAIIIRPSNNYGPWQYPEKLIPLAILKVIKNQKIPLYGRGENIREWLYVDDCAKGIALILKNGRQGRVYHLGSNQEARNIDVARAILNALNAPEDMIAFVKDRPGHDIRYRLNSKKTYDEIGWRPEIKFSEGIKFTVGWYIKHKKWLLSKWRDISRLYNNWR